MHSDFASIVMKCVKYLFEGCTDYNELTSLPAMCGAIWSDRCLRDTQNALYNVNKHGTTHSWQIA